MQSNKMIQENIIINSSLHEKPITADIKYIPSKDKKPLILFVHGFKGFKDWGVFNLFANEMANRGFIFMKINLSHNGTTPENLSDFKDLEAFGNNNFTIELHDLKDSIDYLYSENNIIPNDEIDYNQLNLAGHSRGGGLVILKAREDDRIKKVITLAAISDLSKRWPESFLKEWRDKGVQYIENKRTNQLMPLYVQLYDDVLENPDRLSIPNAIKEMKQPLLAFHGTKDETLPIEMAYQIKEMKPDTELIIYENENHVFGAAHPWKENKLPQTFENILNEIERFLK
ncbi:prolyl oligopeptidase family serine peptidase [Marivirga arenosa]|uniref:Prolyl oligopeptidase family serine peptidase n=1 Tax=Marivirga arenosa TaxID=3059076 RepID=A0AA51N5K5_9BACT|nr:prolyl oligopeptidase family serine peptidase [Marivirga sp. ABR2-2]WMN06448.1 prolyl oligopeptidase family serine peptidase [Marivirga sp. ABR2-2]